MSYPIRSLTVLILLLLAVPAFAQDPYADYNRARAYAQFLNSPASTKTISSYQPGHSWGYDTPLESGRYWQSPGYYHEEVTPYGRSTYSRPPVVNGYVIDRVPLFYPQPVYGLYPPPYPYPR